MMHSHGCKHGGHHGFPGPAFPLILLIPLTMVTAAVCSVLLMKRLVAAQEAMVLAKALDDMKDELSDGERADLEIRVREYLFG
jgi:hypothetical protein